MIFETPASDLAPKTINNYVSWKCTFNICFGGEMDIRQ